MPIYIIPDVYTERIPPTGAPAALVGRGTIALVGKFPKGPKNTLVRAGNWEQFYPEFGGLVIGSAAYDAYMALKNLAAALYIVRVEGTHATVMIVDRQTPTPANKLKLTALVDGEFANYAAGPPKVGIEAIIADGTITNTFKLTLNYYYVKRDVQQTYTETFDNLSLDPEATRYFPTIINASSFLVSAEDLAPANKTPPGHLPATGTYPLAGGVEPDYTGTSSPEGVDIFEKEDDINIVIADKPGSVIRTLLIDHCQKMKDRIAVLSPEQYLDVDEVCAIGDALDVERSTLPYPWFEIYDPVMGKTRDVCSAAGVAGVIARIDPNLSACNHQVYGVLDLERILSRADLETLITSKISPIYWWGTRGIRLRENQTLSSDPNRKEVFRIRMEDFIAETLEDNLGWANSQPITEDFCKAVLGVGQVTLRDMQLSQMIEDFYVKREEATPRKFIVRYGVKLYDIAKWIINRIEVGPDVVITRT